MLFLNTCSVQEPGVSIAGATVINTMLLLRNLQPVGNLTHLGEKKTSPKQIVFCVITEVETKCEAMRGSKRSQL